MSEQIQRTEVITSVQRRRRWSVAEKIRLVEATLEPGMSVSFVARQPTPASKLAGDPGAWHLAEPFVQVETPPAGGGGEVEILKEALAKTRAKKPLLRWPSSDPDGSR